MRRRVLWSAMTPSVPGMHLVRDVRWSLGGIFCLGLLVGAVLSEGTEVYRWQDATGGIHFTNDRSTIPDAYRHQAQTLTIDSTPAAPEVPLPVTPGATSTDSENVDVAPLQQKIALLEQQIAEGEQKRQAYFDQLDAVRPIRMNPAFGQQRRRVADVGRALATVERQLDTLRAELQHTQAAVAAAQKLPPQTDASAMASGWQERFRTAQDRMRQAQERRQVVLTHLSGDDAGQREGFGLRGLEVLEEAKELQQLEQEIRVAEAELRSLNKEAVAARVEALPERRP